MMGWKMENSYYQLAKKTLDVKIMMTLIFTKWKIKKLLLSNLDKVPVPVLKQHWETKNWTW